MFRLPSLLRAAIPAVILSATLAGCAQSPSRDSYVVFFDRDSVSLTPAATAIIHQAAIEARTIHAKHIEVAGSAGMNGDPDVLRELAASRAKAVAMRLQEEGVDGAQITQTSHAPTDIEDSHVALRRVSISLGAN